MTSAHQIRFDLLGKLLSDANIAVEGKSLFIHRMPADCDVGVLIRLPLEGVPVDEYLPGFYKTKFQVIVRESDQKAGDSKSDDIIATLRSLKKRELTENGVLAMTVNQIYLLSLPIVFPRSEDSQSLEWSINFMGSFALPVS